MARTGIVCATKQALGRRTHQEPVDAAQPVGTHHDEITAQTLRGDRNRAGGIALVDMTVDCRSLDGAEPKCLGDDRCSSSREVVARWRSPRAIAAVVTSRGSFMYSACRLPPERFVIAAAYRSAAAEYSEKSIGHSTDLNGPADCFFCISFDHGNRCAIKNIRRPRRHVKGPLVSRAPRQAPAEISAMYRLSGERPKTGNSCATRGMGGAGWMAQRVR